MVSDATIVLFIAGSSIIGFLFGYAMCNSKNERDRNIEAANRKTYYCGRTVLAQIFKKNKITPEQVFDITKQLPKPTSECQHSDLMAN